MTEPGTGSRPRRRWRTTAIRDGDVYVVNGSKTFITNGINADLVDHRGQDRPDAAPQRACRCSWSSGACTGFERGRNLDKIGLHAQDTAELFFDDVRVPVANLLGDEGEGFGHLVQNLPQERLSHRGGRRGRGAPGCLELDRSPTARSAGLRPADRLVPEHPVPARRAGHRDRDRPDVRRPLRARPQRGRADRRGGRHGQVVVHRAAEARSVDRGVQLHGGYGYMVEYPIARAYADARVTTIYGGTTEIMKEIIGRSLGL